MNFMVSPEQNDLIAAVRALACEQIAPHAATWDETEHIPRAQIQKLADFGLFGIGIATH